MTDTTLTDPLGRALVLHDRTWWGHILKGHPELADHRPLVEAAVRQPQEVRLSRGDANCRLYFAPGPRPTVRVLVVADVAQGVVKTAHLTRRTSGGAREWPS